MNDKIAIITPSFNRGYIIRETAESVFAQTHENWEWIIVDDGSTDDSWETIQSFVKKDARVKAHKRKRLPKGACTCRNIGTERSNADWFLFLDTDDLLHPECLTQRLRSSQKTSDEKEVLYFPTLVFENNTEFCMLWDDSEHPIEWIEGVLNLTPACPGTGTLWPESLWRTHGIWREDLILWQDVELHARAHWSGVNFKAAQNTFPDVFIRQSKDSISRIGFHNKPKLSNRMLTIQALWALMAQSDWQESERKALAQLTMRAVQNGANLGLLEEVRTFITRPDVILEKSEMQLALKIIKSRQWELDRIFLVKDYLNQTWSRCFPPSQRKIGATKWRTK